MKILGKSGLTRRVREVPVGYSDGELLVLKIYAPKLGAVDRLHSEIPVPLAPIGKGVMRDRKGNAVTDSNGAPIPLRNEEDPAYKEKLKATARARSLAVLFACLEDQIKPDAKREDHPDPVSYWSAVWAEMEESGFDLAVLLKLQNAANSMVDPDQVEIEEAQAKLGAEGNELVGASSSGSSASGSG